MSEYEFWLLIENHIWNVNFKFSLIDGKNKISISLLKNLSKGHWICDLYKIT